MKNEKFIEVRNKTNSTIKLYIRDKIVNGTIKSVDYSYDKDSNLVCVKCNVSLTKESDIDNAVDIITAEVYRAIFDSCPREEVDSWFGLLLPDIIVETKSTISELHSIINTRMGDSK